MLELSKYSVAMKVADHTKKGICSTLNRTGCCRLSSGVKLFNMVLIGSASVLHHLSQKILCPTV